MQPPAAATGDCSPVSPTFARAAVDPDDPTRLREADASRDQRGVPLTLGGLRRRPWTTPCHRNSSNPRVLRRSSESAGSMTCPRYEAQTSPTTGRPEGRDARHRALRLPWKARRRRALPPLPAPTHAGRSLAGHLRNGHHSTAEQHEAAATEALPDGHSTRLGPIRRLPGEQAIAVARQAGATGRSCGWTSRSDKVPLPSWSARWHGRPGCIDPSPSSA
jgi:hypothetical protein